MKLRGTGGKSSAIAIAVGVASAESISFVYYKFTPWFLSPGDRSFYTSIGFNSLLFILILKLVKQYWRLQTWQDAVKLAVWISLSYLCVSAPYIITWWNPMTYIYLVGPAAHTLLQIAAITLVLWYFKV